MLESEEFCHKSDPKKSVSHQTYARSALILVSQRTTLLRNRFRADTVCQGSDVLQ
jgi:hypothetical protein